MSDDFVFVDRYSATGTPYPDPETMCKGQCEGLGFYPLKLENRDHTPEEAGLWWAAHERPNAHEAEPCDGYHFIACPNCGGTGKEDCPRCPDCNATFSNDDMGREALFSHCCQ